MNKTILVVDDEVKIVILLKDFLEVEGFTVLTAANGEEALDIFFSNKELINLIILDVMMPKMDGWSVCKEVRKQSNVPILMLTAKSEEYDEIHGLHIGADDYVTKPVRPGVLMARIQAMLRRTDVNEESNQIRFGSLEIDKDSHIVKVNEEEINLSPKEYTMLLMLIDNKGKVISREQLLNLVWGFDYFGGLRTVDTHMNRLRMKLMDSGNMIATVRGFGYRFEG